MAERPTDTPTTLTQEIIQKPLGLPNPTGWNCCFLNSTLQLLRSVKELVDYFISDGASLIYREKERVDIARDFDILLGVWNNYQDLNNAHRKFRDKCGELDPMWSNGEQ
jgi:ubiquitin C-terminal hydrolase